MAERFRFRQFIESLQGDGHGEGIAAIGRPVDAGRHTLGGFGGRQTGPHWESVTQGLGQRHDVWLRVIGPLVGEQLACSTEATLHFIQDHQDAMLGAEPAKLAQA